MFFAAFLSITLGPVLLVLLVRGRIRPEARNPINRFLIPLYMPVIHRVLWLRKSIIALAIVALLYNGSRFHAIGI